MQLISENFVVEEAVDQHYEVLKELGAWRARWFALETGLAWPVVMWLQSLKLKRLVTRLRRIRRISR